MSETHALEVVQLVRGPADGDFAEIAVGYHEMWRWVTGVGYCLYARRQRSRGTLTFRHKIVPTQEAMADYIAAHYDPEDPEQAPWVHVDAQTPHARRVRL